MDFREKSTFGFQNSVIWKMYLQTCYIIFIPTTNIYQMSIPSNLLTRILDIIIIMIVIIIMLSTTTTTTRILACTYIDSP